MFVGPTKNISVTRWQLSHKVESTVVSSLSPRPWYKLGHRGICCILNTCEPAAENRNIFCHIWSIWSHSQSVV